jgi:AcrR family transcriptional regulator
MSKPPNPDLIRRILEAALEELDDKPPEKVNMRGIAEKVGVSATAIYYYFPSKEALFERIKLDAIAELDGRAAEAVGRVEGPKARLVALMREFAAWSLERYNIARLAMGDLPPSLDLDDEGMKKYYSVFFRAADLVEEAVAKGEIAPREVLLDASVAQAAIWGIVSQFRGKRVHPLYWESMEPMIERFIELCFESKGDRR